MHTTVLALGYQDNWWQILTSASCATRCWAARWWPWPPVDRLLHRGAQQRVRGACAGAYRLSRRDGCGIARGCPSRWASRCSASVGLVIGALGKRADEREVATGTVLAAATGLGLFFSSQATKSSSTVTNVLFGNLLAVTHEQLMSFGVAVAVLAAVIAFVYRPLLFASINAEVAEAKGGVPVRVLSVVFMALLGLAVTMAVQASGPCCCSLGGHPGRHGDHAGRAAPGWRCWSPPCWRWSRCGPASRCRRCSTFHRVSSSSRSSAESGWWCGQSRNAPERIGESRRHTAPSAPTSTNLGEHVQKSGAQATGDTGLIGR